MAVAQVLTNPVVEGFCGIIMPAALSSFGGGGVGAEAIAFATLAVFEMAAVAVEGTICKKFNFNHPFAMSVTLNLLAFGIGLILSSALPFV